MPNDDDGIDDGIIDCRILARLERGSNFNDYGEDDEIPTLTAYRYTSIGATPVEVIRPDDFCATAWEASFSIITYHPRWGYVPFRSPTRASPIVDEANRVIGHVGWFRGDQIIVQEAYRSRISELRDILRFGGLVFVGSIRSVGASYPGKFAEYATDEQQYLVVTRVDGQVLGLLNSGVIGLVSADELFWTLLAIGSLLIALGKAGALRAVRALVGGGKELTKEIAESTAGKIEPVAGEVNVGGGFETPNITNLNPLKPASGGPVRGIPNHVLGSMEDMDQIFARGSVKKLWSSKLRFVDVDWPRATGQRPM
jgi:hypothetical protein